MKRVLTDKEILEIYALLDKPAVYGVDVAKRYGVSNGTISRIWTGKLTIKGKEGK